MADQPRLRQMLADLCDELDRLALEDPEVEDLARRVRQVLVERDQRSSGQG